MKYQFSLFLMTILIVIVGCTPSYQKADYSKNIPQIRLSKDVKLELSEIWPLPSQGSYLQRITIQKAAQSNTLSLFLTLQHESFNAVVFNDILGKLYQITLSPTEFSEEASPYLKSRIPIAYILGDFFSAYLPTNRVKVALSHAQVEDIVEGDKTVRLIWKERTLLRKITFSKEDQFSGKIITIENPVLGYNICIETKEI